MKISEKMASRIPRMLDAGLLGALNATRFAARFLPPRALTAAADGLGSVIYYTRAGAREYMLETMREALPDVKGEEELRRVARRAFGAPFRAILDTVLFERHGDRIMEKLILAKDTHTRYDAAMKTGGGMIVFSPHLGGIGITFSVSARIGRLFTPLALSPWKTPFPRFLNALAEISASLGCDPENPVFWTGMQTIPKVQEHLKRGGSVGITFDMVGGTVMDFFGRPTAIASGIGHFACDSGAPILAYCLKRYHDPLQYELCYYGEVEYELTGDRSADVRAILGAVIRKGEEMIRDAPEQWIMWFALKSWRARARKILEQAGPA